jgi:uncharacterized protein
MNSQIHHHSTQIAQLCANLGVQRLDVFGSASESDSTRVPADFDFVVALDARADKSRARRWIALAEGLEALLGKPVDLVSEASLSSPHFIRSLEAQRHNVYQHA